MNIPISNRLLACCQFVRPGDRVADVGCDHGYLGIYLLQKGIASAVLASDLNEAPLRSAYHNAHKYGVGERMTFYLSDGVRKVPRDFDCMVCAGMGADTMVSILEAAPWLCAPGYRLILQCQSKTPVLRRYLSDHGWEITDEAVLREGKFLYTVMEVHYHPNVPRLEVDQWYFPKVLRNRPEAAVEEYYHWVLNGLEIAVAHQDDPEKKAALAALKEDWR